MTLTKAIIRHAILAASLGTLTVVSVLPLHALFFVIWLVIVARIAVEIGKLEARFSRAALLTEIIVMGAVLTAAAWAPVKIVDQRLAQEFVLPKTEITLAEMRSPDFPLYRAFFGPDEHHHPGDETIIHFPRQKLTLREFIAAVESQSKLEDDFSCCGNGWTILWGDYCGPAYFSPPMDEVAATDTE